MQVTGEADLKKAIAGIEAQISQLSRALDETAVLLEPLSWFQNFADNRISRTQAFLTGAALLVEETSRAHQVNAALHYTHFDLERIPAEYSQTIVEVLTQLLRNAVAHGIEPPGERQEAGKPVRGLIYLASRHSSKYYRFSVQDDGRGLNPADLKAAVAASETFSHMVTGAMTAAELAAFLFEPGFTTSKSPSHSAGCGMGLNLVVQKLSALAGRLEFVFTRGKGCRFEFILPVPKAC
jgi:signal transduction histidine kinase